METPIKPARCVSIDADAFPAASPSPELLSRARRYAHALVMLRALEVDSPDVAVALRLVAMEFQARAAWASSLSAVALLASERLVLGLT